MPVVTRWNLVCMNLTHSLSAIVCVALKSEDIVSGAREVVVLILIVSPHHLSKMVLLEQFAC